MTATPLRPKLGALALVSAVLMLVGASSASAMTIYDNLPTASATSKKLPKNTVSLGFQATSTSEFGGLVGFSSSRRGRSNPRITFTLSDWACQTGGGTSCVTGKHASYTWPVTVNVYEVGAGNSVGALLASKTETVTIPYRPSASTSCTGEEAGGWYEKKTKECFSGILTKYTYEFTGVTLPSSEAIISVAYNTQSHGAAPTGVEGPENSLNVGLSETAPSTGTDPLPEDVFVNSTWNEMYCAGATDIGSFGDSGACWAPYQASFEVRAAK